MRDLLVSDIMTREPIKVNPSTSLLECAKAMVKKKTGSLVIADGKKLLGFISREDILWALVKKSKDDLSKIKAIEISPKKITTIKPEASVMLAFKKMKSQKFERLPVVSDGELVGIITIKDILSFTPEIYPELDELLQIKEEEEKIKRIKERGGALNDGICEECGKRNFLHRFNGMLVCESCMNSS